MEEHTKGGSACRSPRHDNDAAAAVVVAGAKEREKMMRKRRERGLMLDERA